MDQPYPLPAEDRLSALDLIRGVAVLGVLLANLPHFCGPDVTSWASLPRQDHWVAAFTRLVVDAKFITMLAILFGAGLALQHDRARATGRPFVAPYIWRQFLLYLLGISHVVFLWFGDILATYALVSMYVLVIVTLGPGWEKAAMVFGIAWGYLLLLLFFLGLVVLTLAAPQALNPPNSDPLGTEGPPVSLLEDHNRYMSADNQIRIYRHGTFLDQMVNRIIKHLAHMIMLPLATLWYIGACFLIGVQLIRLQAFEPHTRPAWVFNDFLTLGLWVGLPLHIASVVWSLLVPSSWFPSFLHLAGVLPQALMYLALLTWWNESSFWPGLQERFRAVGRMALTNYLMQSVICVLVFNNFGLGLYGQTGLLGGLVVVVSIWAAELLWSPWWLARFRMGPIEWLWRSAVALRPLPVFKREEVKVSA
jgi:uncharacterized protein